MPIRPLKPRFRQRVQPLALIEGFDVSGEPFDLALFVQAGAVGLLAMLAELADQPLGHDADDGGADQVRFDAEVI